MKFIQLSFIALIISFSAFAQQKTTNKAVIKTPGITCEQCKERIEKALFKQYGILSATTNVKAKTTTVTWVTDRTNIEQIKVMIANAGYDADDETAEETAYMRLPACCKKPAETTGAKH